GWRTEDGPITVSGSGHREVERTRDRRRARFVGIGLDAGRIEGPDAVAVSRRGRQSGINVGGAVGGQDGDLAVTAAPSDRALDAVTAFVRRIVCPAERQLGPHCECGNYDQGEEHQPRRTADKAWREETQPPPV